MTSGPSDMNLSRVSVIGAARSGLAAARLLRYHGKDVLLSEFGDESRFEGARAEMEAIGAAVEFGGHSEAVFEAGTIVVSPGVPSDAPVLVAASEHGIPIVSELELASMFCEAPIVAITGTNGKTTTTTLTGEIFRAAGLGTIVAGNIGFAFSDALLASRAKLDAAVLEVSSFQLDFTVRFHPRIAVITTITPDHLARYKGDYGEYIASKQRVYRNQYTDDALIYSADNADADNAAQVAAARKFPTSVTRPLTAGGWMEGRKLFLNTGEGKELLTAIDDMRLRGKHNYMNTLQAALAARLFGIKMDVVSEAVRQFEGVEHRLEFVRRLDGVAYINDSKATNVDSVVIALQSFAQPVVLIAGGRDKDAPYDPLLPLLESIVKAVVLIGEAADRMEDAFSGHAEIRRAASMQEAVTVSRDLASPGDVVLLSPACASFDMFDNFEQRGLVFKHLVLGLASRSNGA